MREWALSCHRTTETLPSCNLGCGSRIHRMTEPIRPLIREVSLRSDNWAGGCAAAQLRELAAPPEDGLRLLTPTGQLRAIYNSSSRRSKGLSGLCGQMASHKNTRAYTYVHAISPTYRSDNYAPRETESKFHKLGKSWECWLDAGYVWRGASAGTLMVRAHRAELIWSLFGGGS